LPEESRLDALPQSERCLFPELFAEQFPPTLLLHGRADTVVLLEESETTLRQMREKGKEVKLVVLEDSGHGFLPAGPSPTPAAVAYAEAEAFLLHHFAK